MGQVWSRENWNAIVQRVNNLCTSPPSDTDCETVGTLPLVEAHHIWTETDITQVRNKLREICSDNSFSAELRIWSQAVIDEINNAIGRGWCNCEPEEDCRPECSNAQGLTVSYGGSHTASGCVDTTNVPNTGATTADRLAIAGHAGDAALAGLQYTGAQTDACVLGDQLEDLEDELDDMRATLAGAIITRDAACGPSGNAEACAEAQAEVAGIQSMIADKEDEIADKRAERDAKQAQATAAANAAATAANACMQAYASIVYFGGVHTTWSSFIPAAPWADRTCDDMGPPCLSRTPARCKPAYWSVQRRITQNFVNAPTYVGNWGEVLRGAYTPTGQPYITSSIALNSANGPPVHACIASCASPPCELSPCWRSCYPVSTNVYEARVEVKYPDPTGEECC